MIISKLFEPSKIGMMELKNRIVMPAIQLNYANNAGFVTNQLENFYEERAKGGVGLIIVGSSYTEPLGRSFTNMLGIAEDRFIPGLKRLVDIIHSYGAKAALQIYHAGRYAPSTVIGSQPVSASAIPSTLTKEMPKELAISEIETIIENFAKATERAKRSGFDAVEILAGGGYLISQFLSPLTNKRSDRYGGNLEARMTFLLEIVQSIRRNMGKEFPLLCRISGDELMEGGNTLDEARIIAAALEKSGADAINVFGGWHESRVPQISMCVPRGAFAYLSQGIKEVVNIPVVAGVRINDPLLAEQILKDEKADFIAMARALIADPELPNKAKKGAFDEIRPCVACLQGCLENLFRSQPIRCLVNPSAGREEEYTIKPVDIPKKVLVIGGGAGGMEAARVAALRGCKAFLYEKSGTLGGQLNLAAIPPAREEFASLVRYLSGQISKLSVEVHLSEEVTPALLKELRPDVVIAATGAIPIVPDIPGINSSSVVFANDVLAGRVDVGERVIIVGGGAVGCETALFLAKKGAISPQVLTFLIENKVLGSEKILSLIRKGKKVTIIEMLNKIGKDVSLSNRWILLQELARYTVDMLTGVTVEVITKEGLTIVDKGGKRQVLKADTVVIAVGSKPDRALFKELMDKVPEFYEIGDCITPRKAIDAIYEGFDIAHKL